MPRDIPVGNGRVLVTFDKSYQIRDLYFPHIGQENHIKETPFRFGLWTDSTFSWIPFGWEIKRDYLDDSLVTSVVLTHRELELKILINDLVDFHEDIYMKRITVEDLSGREREVRLFFTQDLHIYGNEIGNTAAYRPEAKGLLHYKDERYFLINTSANKMTGIEHFATGKRGDGGLEGTWRDAEDGHLSGNPIAQGTVDSVAAIHLNLEAYGKERCYYWISMGRSWSEVLGLNTLISKRGPEVIFKRTHDYWKLWTNKEKLNLDLVPESLARLYKRSLLIIRTQIDSCGSIIAANDSDVTYFNRDTYSYMWPRDAALVAYGLDLAGYSEITRRFFNLCGKIIEDGGYFMHKYTPSGSMASSWHPWLRGGKSQLPIQEDETALVIWTLWKHYEIFRDIEFIKPLYKTLVKRGGEMMMGYRDFTTRLPLPSYDLWEERQGVLTFTVSAVYGGLRAAANFAEAFGEDELAGEYLKGAAEIRAGMDRYLYMEDKGRFCRMINIEEGLGGDPEITIDPTIDASLYGIFAFGAYHAGDEKVVSTMDQVCDSLWCKTDVGGVARYDGDEYHRVSGELPGNPWFVTTLWLAQHHIAKGKSKEEIDKALTIMEWVAERALPSGVLAEQVNPYTNDPLSVSPLTWSHGTFVITINEYINKLLEIERCEECGQSKYSRCGCEA